MTTINRTLDFAAIKTAVSGQFDSMKAFPLFRVDVEGWKVWDTYLNSFPSGSDPLYRERSEHNCSTCKNFIRGIGNVVALVDGNLVSIWDVETEEPAYNEVLKAMSALVHSAKILEPYLSESKEVGVDKTFEQVADGVLTWRHFHVTLPSANVMSKGNIPTKLSESRSAKDVFLRSLKEITLDSIDTFLELVAQGSIYRGEEHKALVQPFRSLKLEFDLLSGEEVKDIFAWEKSLSQNPAVIRVRSTVVGTFLIDLSEGMELERAVAAFESKVAPTNYKRPTAVVTKGMIQKAKEKIEELGLSTALERRYAVLEDVSIGNVLFADRAARKVLTGDVFDELIGDSKDRAPKNLGRVEEITIDRFLSDVLPLAESLEVLVENKHIGNFVSLVAPTDPDAPRLFKWNNPFSWSYAGEVADSMKERVKKAGGNVTGDFCCRLAWYNHDDLDFHMKEPDGGHIYFSNKGPSKCGGRLDVDMNASSLTREPVENIFYSSRSSMKEGVYELSVHNFRRRENTNDGFEVEIDFLGEVYSFSTQTSPKDKGTTVVARMEYSRKEGLKMLSNLESRKVSKNFWGISTENFHPVNVVTLSPNFWDNQVLIGNKHVFFMLDGAVNDGAARGFYNEMLISSLDPHRKVMELVGSKLRLADAAHQLSGLGFSSTQRSDLVCRVKGSFTRTLKIVF